MSRQTPWRVRHIHLPPLFDDQTPRRPGKSRQTPAQRTASTVKAASAMAAVPATARTAKAVRAAKAARGPGPNAFIEDPRQYVYGFEYALTKNALNNVALHGPLSRAAFDRAQLVAPATWAPRQEQVPLVGRRHHGRDFNAVPSAQTAISFSRRKPDKR
jgi:hypothetical protein